MFAADAVRVGPRWVGRENLLEADVMLPAGDEIIVVGEALTRAQAEADQGHGMWVGGAGAADAATSIVLTMNPEAVQVAVVPAHRHLNDTMELSNARVAADQHTAPDQRGHVTEDKPELVDAWSGLAHRTPFYATATTPSALPPAL